MSELLEVIYDTFYSPDKPDVLLEEIEKHHRTLIETLGKEERKILLRIIDAKDQLMEAQSIDSFNRGFQIAWQLCTELNCYAADHPIRPVSDLYRGVDVP